MDARGRPAALKHPQVEGGWRRGAAALFLLLRTSNALKPWRVFHAALGCAGLTLVCMVIWRDILRDATVRPFLALYSLPTAPQWGALAGY